MTDASRYDVLFRPIRVGSMQLRNRVMLPPHASAVGTLWGTQAQAGRERRRTHRRSGAPDGVAAPGSLTTRLGLSPRA